MVRLHLFLWCGKKSIDLNAEFSYYKINIWDSDLLTANNDKLKRVINSHLRMLIMYNQMADVHK